jgi:hypothetical protein
LPKQQGNDLTNDNKQERESARRAERPYKRERLTSTGTLNPKLHMSCVQLLQPRSTRCMNSDSMSVALLAYSLNVSMLDHKSGSGLRHVQCRYVRTRCCSQYAASSHRTALESRLPPHRFIKQRGTISRVLALLQAVIPDQCEQPGTKQHQAADCTESSTEMH